MLLPLCSNSAAADTVFSGAWKGQSAEAAFADDNGGGSLTVFQNSGNTNLHFAIWGDDPTSEFCQVIIDDYGTPVEVCIFTRSTYEYGWGTIPSTDVQFSAQSAQLETTTGAGFTSTRCVTDKSTATPVTTCAPGNGGYFDVTWTGNGHYSSAGNGSEQQTYGSYTFKTSGPYKGSSAFANGYALDRSLTNAPGELRQTTGKTAIKTITVN